MQSRAAEGLSAGTSSGRCWRRATRSVAWTASHRRLAPGPRGRRERRRRSPGDRRLHGGLRGDGRVLPTRRRHGRHGLHREQQGAVHALGPDQHAYAAGGRRARTRSRSSIPLPPVFTMPTSRRAKTWFPSGRRTPTPRSPKTATVGRNCFPSGCAATSGRTSGLRTRVASLPQRVRARMAIGGRQGKGAGGDMPQGGPGQTQRQARYRDLGDGKQTRSFMYIDDCLKGTQDIMNSGILEPINLGSNEVDDHRRARGYGRGDRRREARAALQTRCSQGR